LLYFLPASFLVGIVAGFTGWLLGGEKFDYEPTAPGDCLTVLPVMGILYLCRCVYSLPWRLLKPLLRETGNQVLEIKKKQ
jgi:hypothetical protein